MLNWRPLPEDELAQFAPWGGGWVERALNSTGFERETSTVELKELPGHIQKRIEEEMPNYEKLYALRLVADKH